MKKTFELENSRGRQVTRVSGGTFEIDKKSVSNQFIKKYDRFIVEKKTGKLLVTLKNIFGLMGGSFYNINVPTAFKSLFYLIVPGPFGINEGRILDIGCSTGAFLESLPAGWKKQGVEVNLEACKIGRKKGLPVVYSDFENYNTENMFDVIRASHVIEHTKDPSLFVKKAAKLTKPGGKIIIYTPNADSFSRRVFNSKWEGFYDDTHFYIFSRKSLIKLFSKNGFRVGKNDSYFMGYSISSLIRFLGLRDTDIFRKAFPMLYLISFPFSLLRFLIPNLQGGALYVEFIRNGKN